MHRDSTNGDCTNGDGANGHGVGSGGTARSTNGAAPSGRAASIGSTSGAGDTGPTETRQCYTGQCYTGQGDTGPTDADAGAGVGPPGGAPSGARVDRALLTEVVAQFLAARPPLHATIHKPQIQVVVALDTLLGSDRPAELVGHGPIDAVTARALAAGGVWARLVTDRLSGRLLDYGRDVYAPPADLADFVRARDLICRGPGCTRKIAELDHHIPFGGGHGGTTSEANLDGYCKQCHLLKDAPGWNALAGGEDHLLTWISPHGRRTVTAPYDYRPFTDPLTDTPVTAGPRGPGASGVPAGDDAPPF